MVVINRFLTTFQWIVSAANFPSPPHQILPQSEFGFSSGNSTSDGSDLLFHHSLVSACWLFQTGEGLWKVLTVNREGLYIYWFESSLVWDHFLEKRSGQWQKGHWGGTNVAATQIEMPSAKYIYGEGLLCSDNVRSSVKGEQQWGTIRGQPP